MLVGGVCGTLFVAFICFGQYSIETFSRVILPTTTEQCMVDSVYTNVSDVLFDNVTWSTSAAVAADGAVGASFAYHVEQATQTLLNVTAYVTESSTTDSSRCVQTLVCSVYFLYDADFSGIVPILTLLLL